MLLPGNGSTRPITEKAKALATESLAEQLDASVQTGIPRGKDTLTGTTVFTWLTTGTSLVAPWWSRQRDSDLRQFWRRIDHLSGAVYTFQSKVATTPFRVLPRDRSIAAHVRLASEVEHNLLVASQFGDGWTALIERWVEDRSTQDNGSFIEIIGNGNPAGPLTGSPLGLAHLDASRCQRTGNPDYPVLYTALDGARHKLHHTRVLFAAQQPSADARMFGVGFCAVSRCVNIAQNLLDILVFKQEKLGSRPHRRMMITRGGLDPEDIASAFAIAEEAMDNASLSRYARTVVVGNRNIKDAGVEDVSLANLPDGFDEQQSVTLGMATIALAFGMDARELFPALGGGTRADAYVQHLKAAGKGIGHEYQVLERLLNYKVLPASLYFEFDYRDDAEDQQQAQIRHTRSSTHQINLATGAINTRTAREQMLADGDLTEEQFVDLELADGRLSDSRPIELLFYSTDPDYTRYLRLNGITDPLAIETNDAFMTKEAIAKKLDAVRNALANSREGQRTTLEQCLAALTELQKKYAKRGTAAVTPAPVPATTSAFSSVLPPAIALMSSPPEITGQGQPLQESLEEGSGIEKGKVILGPADRELMKLKDAASFAYHMRTAVRGLWTDALDRDAFIDTASLSIDRGLHQAWYEGAASCGVEQDELEEPEMIELYNLVYDQIAYLPGYADAIIANNRTNHGKLGTQFDRLDLWINQYNAVRTRAQLMACANHKLKWVLGPTAEHCSSCLAYSEKVYRANVWAKYNIAPQSHDLECGGWRCLCRFEPTDEKVTSGKPTKL